MAGILIKNLIPFWQMHGIIKIDRPYDARSCFKEFKSLIIID